MTMNTSKERNGQSKTEVSQLWNHRHMNVSEAHSVVPFREGTSGIVKLLGMSVLSGR